LRWVVLGWNGGVGGGEMPRGWKVWAQQEGPLSSRRPAWGLEYTVLRRAERFPRFFFADEAAGLTGPEDGREPLIIRLDPDDSGSVGSLDSDSELSGDECEHVTARINEAIRTLNPASAGGGGGAGGGDEESSESHEDAEGTTGEAGAAARPAALAAGAEEEGEHADAALQSALAAGAAVADLEAGDVGEKAPGAVALGMMDCSVCMIRPTQVVLVPCGHICLCRRCSRRLHRCPICRKDIARRQRLYI
jgi:Zinc finger, C3HC4 type (RING finger)